MPRARGPLLSTALAVAIGIVVLLDVIIDTPTLDLIGRQLVEYGLIIAVFALFLGVLNVLTVHGEKVQRRAEGWPYSLMLVAVTLALIAVGIVTGPDRGLLAWTFDSVLLPLQSTFAALLAFFLLSVAYRRLRVNSLDRALFVIAAVVVIVGSTPLGALFGTLLVDARDWLVAIPAAAGARGLLLGIALGTIATGLRLIFDGYRYFR